MIVNYHKGFFTILLRLIVASLSLSGSLLANVVSVTGDINLDVDNDGSFEATLSSNGLSLGASLWVRQNLDMQGTVALLPSTMSASGNLGNYSKVVADTSASDISLYLPYAGNVAGRVYSIKKISKLNKLYLIAGPQCYVDNLSLVEFTAGSLTYVTVFSDGHNWYVEHASDAITTIASDNLLAYYFFDSAAGGVITDQSINGNDATITNTTSTEDGLFGQSVDLYNNYVRSAGLASALDSESGSLAYWFNAASWDGAQNDYHVNLMWESSYPQSGIKVWYWSGDGANNFRLYLNRNQPAGNKQVTTALTSANINQWHHVALTWDVANDQYSGYVNGTLVDTKTGLQSFNGNTLTTSNAEIGATHAIFSADIRIDEMSFYDKPLSAEEVQLLYQSGAGNP